MAQSRTPGGGRPRELPKVLTKTEVAALLAIPNLDAPTGLRNRCILELMYGAGLRVSETCGLRVRDMDWGEGRLHLRPEITKGDKEAYVTVSHRVEAMLERWKHVRRAYAARQPHLFTTLEGGPVDRRYVWSMVGRYARRAGLADKRVHPHMLRHSFATHLLQDGYDLRQVQTLLRHDDVRTTTIYTHVFDAELHRRLRERE